MRCPECGGEVEIVRAAEGGCIEESVFLRYPRRDGEATTRRTRPATFAACGTCEWCSENRKEVKA